MARSGTIELTDKQVARIRRWAWYWAGRLGYRHPYLDREDFAAIAVIEALRVLGQWEKDKGALATFLVPRMKGAIQNAQRDYRRSRRPAGSYRDHETLRFGQLAGADGRSVEDLLPGVPAASAPAEVADELAWLRRRVTRCEWLILVLGFGGGLSQRDTVRPGPAA
jgi:hypothetical protein